jgi:hypothetical protein
MTMPTRNAALSTILPLLALLAAGAAAAQAEPPVRLSITVVDHESGAPVRNARVDVAGVRQPAYTNGRGVAWLEEVPAGNRIVTVTRLGYAGGSSP